MTTRPPSRERQNPLARHFGGPQESHHVLCFSSTASAILIAACVVMGVGCKSKTRHDRLCSVPIAEPGRDVYSSENVDHVTGIAALCVPTTIWAATGQLRVSAHLAGRGGLGALPVRFRLQVVGDEKVYVTTGPDEVQFHRDHRDPDQVGMEKTLGHCDRTAAQSV